MVLALDSSSLLCLLTVSSLICTSSLNFLLISSSWWSRRWTLSSDEVRADRSFKISALLLIRLSSKCLHSEQPACVQFNVVIHVCKHHNLHVQHHSLSLSLSLSFSPLSLPKTHTHISISLCLVADFLMIINIFTTHLSSQQVQQEVLSWSAQMSTLMTNKEHS